jgi:predicted metal-dependent peptidase
VDAALTDGQRLSAAILAAEKRFPYFATGFAGLVRRFAPVGTMAISANGVLLVDPEFLLAIEAAQAGEEVAHELLHLLRRHAERMNAIPQVNREVAGIATDCEINDDLKLENLPCDPCLPAKYRLKNGLLAEEYYQALLQQAQRQAAQAGGAGEPQDGEDAQEGAGSASDDGQGNGQSRSGTGRQGADAKPGQCQGGRAGKADVARGRCGSGSGGPPVEGEPEGAAGAKGRSAADMDRIRRDVAEAIIAHAAAKGRGSVPAGILVWSESELQPPKIRWQDQLRRAVRANVATIAGRVDYTRVRFSRRQAAVGAVSRALGGRAPILPALCAPKPRVAFGVDTSGSMGVEELRRAVSEAQGCLRALGVPIVFLACDAEVHANRGVKSAVELVANLKGGGGTSFIPIFEAVEKLRPRVDLFVFVTDGQGPAPAEAPRGLDTIWVLVGEYASAPCTWGKQITIKD